MIFTKLALLAQKHHRRTVVVALLFLVAAGLFGAPVSATLPAGGYEHSDSESGHAEQVLTDRFGAGGMSIVFTIAGDDGADGRYSREAGQRVVDALTASPYASQIISYWSAPPQFADALRSSDGRIGLVAARIAGGDSDAPPRAHDIADPLIGTDDHGVEVSAGGLAIVYHDVNLQSRTDLIVSELIAIPLTFLVLVWVFGSVIAAILPIAVAVFAIAGTTAILRVVSYYTDVSVFALNLATALSLALAIDYTLFMISRYREEVAAGRTRDAALVRAMNTAGRTVTYSALIVAPSLAAMVIFPVYFLRSLAFAGIASVAFCLLGSLVVAPAIIVALGDRIDALDLRKPVYRIFKKTQPRQRIPEQSFWYRTAIVVMRRAVPIGLAVVALLLLLGIPFQSVKLGYADDRLLPHGSESRQVGDALRDQFTQDHTGAVRIVFPDFHSSPHLLDDYAVKLSKLDNVTSVASPNGLFINGRQATVVAYGADMRDGAAYMTVSSTEDPYSDSGKAFLEEIKTVAPPAEVLFSGLAQQDIDNVDAIVRWVPAVLGIIAVATFLLIFLMTGSVLLPIKAIILNVLSQTAAFGALVWIFQDGALNGLGTTSLGYLAAFMPVLIFCISFGISMDYEVFLLSRMREEWLKSDRSSTANSRSVALGLAHTGRIVTAAATVMAVVFIAMTASGVSFMRMLGLGLALTVLVDAFVIRTILVPAFMQLVGRYNWWSPRPLAAFHAKVGFTEHPDDADEGSDSTFDTTETRTVRVR